MVFLNLYRSVNLSCTVWLALSHESIWHSFDFVEKHREPIQLRDIVVVVVVVVVVLTLTRVIKSVVTG